MTHVQKLLFGSVSVALLAAAAVWSTAPAPPEPAVETGASSPSATPPQSGSAPAVAPAPLPQTAAAVPMAPSAKAQDEGALMALLRQVRESEPSRAIALAREGNERFPDSPDAAERHSILIHALAADNRPSEARGEAEQMVNHYPDSTWVREIEAFTGAHRHRNLRVRDDGELEYYN